MSDMTPDGSGPHGGSDPQGGSESRGTTPLGSSMCPPLLLLIAISAIGPVALNIPMPSMPGMQAAFSTDYATVQLTLTVYLIAMGVAQLGFGPLSDRFGRKPVLMSGIALFITGSVLAIFAPSIEWLIFARLIQGFGGASGVAISRAIVRDCFSRERSASMLGYVTMGMVVGPMIAPYLGGRLDEVYGWPAPFAALVALALPLLLAVGMILRETHTNRTTGAIFAPMIQGAATLLASKAFWAYALTLGFASAAFFSFLAAAPLIAIDVMGLKPSDYGLYFPLGALGYMLGNFLSGRLSERVGPDRMIRNGNIVGLIATASMVALALAGVMHPLALFLPMTVTALSNGLVIPNAIASCVSIRPDLAGAASGLAGSMQLGIGAIGTIVTGYVLDGTLLPLAIVMLACMVLASVTAMLARVQMQRVQAA